MENSSSLGHLIFLFSFVVIFSFLRATVDEKRFEKWKNKLPKIAWRFKTIKMEEELKKWWEGSENDEEDFVKKFQNFLEINPPQSIRRSKKKTHFYLKKVREILLKKYLREEIISCETYEKLLDLIFEREKQLLSN